MQSCRGGGGDAFVARVDGNGSTLLFSTYFGGNATEQGHGLAVGVAGRVDVVGRSDSFDLPVTTGAIQATSNGPTDTFLMRLEPSNAVALFGAPTTFCSAPAGIGVNSVPKAGMSTFALHSWNAPAAAQGFLVLSLGQLGAPIAVQGIQLWVDPSLLLAVLTWASDANGCAKIPLPIPPGTAGITAAAQWVWLDPCAPRGLSATEGLWFTVQ
jgi:hypothetical protein